MFMRVARLNKKKPNELNEMQLRFIKEYLKDLNSSQAYLRAGYKTKAPDVCGCRMLGDVRISKAIAKEFEIRSAKVDLSVEMIIKELHGIATSNVADIYAEDGTIKPISTLPLPLQKAISSIEVDEIWEWAESTTGRKVKEQIGTTKKIRFWEKTKSLELLGKYLAMWIERSEVSGPGGAPLIPSTFNILPVAPVS